jgi:hypothetical protein
VNYGMCPHSPPQGSIFHAETHVIFMPAPLGAGLQASGDIF